MLTLPCSYISGLVGMNRFKDKWETIAALITRYNKDVLKLYLNPSEIQKLQNSKFYVDSRKAAIVKQILRGEDVYIPLRYRNQVSGIIQEKKHKFKSAHEFVKKDFETFSLYGQTDGLYKNRVLEFKTRMKYYYIPPHDLIQIGCYMLIKKMPGVLLQDLHGKLKEAFFELSEMEDYMKPKLEKLKEVVREIGDIFLGKISEKNRKILKYCLKHS